MEKTNRHPPRRTQAVKADFALDQQVVHASHGVGRVSRWQEVEVDGKGARMLVIDFPASGMTMRVPAAKLGTAGLRHVSSDAEMSAALATLATAPVSQAGPWKSATAAYLEKLNTGKPGAWAELVRDLRHRGNAGCARIYDDALTRLSEELALVEAVTVSEARARIEARCTGPEAPA